MMQLPTTTRSLRRLMRRHKLTCPEVAQLVDRHVITVRNWHRGAPPPRPREVKYLELVLAAQQ